jgi:hypothetical protein
MPFALIDHQLELVMAAPALLDPSKCVILMERITANLRRTGLPNFCARDLAMPRRAPSFPHLLPNLITDHKPFISRECVESAIDALGANDGQ